MHAKHLTRNFVGEDHDKRLVSKLLVACPRRIISISGVHDLRPLRRIALNDTLGITVEEALSLSPALLLPRSGFDGVAWVGADETPEFRRQNALLGIAWGGYTAMQVVEAPGLNHFDVIAPLADPESDLSRMVVG